MNKWKSDMEQRIQELETEVKELRELVEGLTNCHVMLDAKGLYHTSSGELRAFKKFTHKERLL